MATGDIWFNEGAARVWTGSGVNEFLDATSLAAGDIVLGSFHDYGPAPRADAFKWSGVINGLAAAGTPGQGIDIYLVTSDTGSAFDGTGSGSDPTDTAQGTMTLGGLRNAIPAGTIAIETTTPGDILRNSGRVPYYKRYVAVAMHNNTGVDLAAVNTHSVTLTPVNLQTQP